MAEQIRKYLDNEGLAHLIGKLVNGTVKGKGLVAPSVITEIQEKLKSVATTDGLSQLTEKVTALESLLNSDKSDVKTAIDTFNEIVAFLDGIDSSETETLAPIVRKVAGIEDGAQKNTVLSVAGNTGHVTLTKSDVALDNVDNTSDANKPVSTAQAAAISDAKAAGTAAAAALDEYKTSNDAALKAVSDKVDAAAKKEEVYTKTIADSKFVAKEAGKALSTNDYTAADKAAVGTIAGKLDEADYITTDEIDALCV